MGEFFLEKTSSRLKFSSTIETILKECRDIQNPPFQHLTRTMQTQLSRLSLAYDQISNTDLNPIKFEASRAYQNGKKRLSAYLKDKNRVQETMNKERLDRLLRNDYPKSSLDQLSFDSFQEDNVSYLVKKNKRKFGEGYIYKGYSTNTSPQNIMLPSIKNSPKNSPLGHKPSNNLNNMITSLIDKKLGILPRKKTIYPKRKVHKSVDSQILIRSPISIIDLADKQEDQYLNPEFRNYNSNVGNKLRIQKIMVEKHTRDRRQTVMQLPFIKSREPLSSLDFI
ncbi:hypothetical protein SteCoe_18645 [Stentor coeruleus]|uniref:Uncharacterized protein n=1 Tax=Stentor coeruleus TaxID=5963 RepID=A0A1R2BVZ0_9CILI|nr:hypothetical protein SteCoe_18645 [Stentor coeruleus]